MYLKIFCAIIIFLWHFYTCSFASVIVLLNNVMIGAPIAQIGAIVTE